MEKDRQITQRVKQAKVFPGIRIRIQTPDISKQLFVSVSQSSVLLFLFKYSV